MSYDEIARVGGPTTWAYYMVVGNRRWREKEREREREKVEEAMMIHDHAMMSMFWKWALCITRMPIMSGGTPVCVVIIK